MELEIKRAQLEEKMDVQMRREERNSAPNDEFADTQ